MTPGSVTVLSGQASVRIEGGAQITLNQPREVSVAVVGIQGLAGAPGSSVDSLLQVLAQDVFTAGQPVYVGQSDGRARLASAAALTTAPVIGVAQTTTASGFMVSVQTRYLTLADWTAVAGTALLTKGATYFLSLTAGRITLSAPTIPGNAITRMGIASAVDTLALNIFEPVLL